MAGVSDAETCRNDGSSDSHFILLCLFTSLCDRSLSAELGAAVAAVVVLTCGVLLTGLEVDMAADVWDLEYGGWLPFSRTAVEVWSSPFEIDPEVSTDGAVEIVFSVLQISEVTESAYCDPDGWLLWPLTVADVRFLLVDVASEFAADDVVEALVWPLQDI